MAAKPRGDVEPLRQLVLSSPLDLAELNARGTVAAFGVGPQGSVWLAFCLTPGEDRKLDTSGVAFPLSLAAAPRDYDVFECSLEGQPTARVTIRSEPYVVHFIQPLPERVLLVSGRCRRRTEDVEHNGRVYRRDGSWDRELLLGDGIAAVQTTTRGLIWASYFDEGVFGNFGWREPLGSSGLVAWNADGTKHFDFEPSTDMEPIADCYALNVVSDVETWIYYYTPFDLVRLEELRISGRWTAPVGGCNAFAVAEGHVLLHGGYEHRNDLVLCSLGAEEAAVVSRFSLRTPAGDPIAASRVAGRGDALYLLDGERVYRVRVLDALNAADS